jgi:hypothetical protein
LVDINEEVRATASTTVAGELEKPVAELMR